MNYDCCSVLSVCRQRVSTSKSSKCYKRIDRNSNGDQFKNLQHKKKNITNKFKKETEGKQKFVNKMLANL